MNATDPLANLRDIHLPDAISTWPPAPGWWILALLMLSLIVWGGLKLWKQHQQKFMLRLSLSKVGKLETEYQNHQDALLLLRQYSTLIRRVCLARFGRQKVAGLTGNNWLNFLNQSTDLEHFDNDAGQLLVNAPYMKETTINANIEELTANLKLWIKAVNQPQTSSKNSKENNDD